jgi:hypothetical protein
MSVIENTTSQTPWLNIIRRQYYKSAEARYVYVLVDIFRFSIFGCALLPLMVAVTRLEDEIWAYVDYMAPTPEEEILVVLVGEHVRGTLRPVFPGCKIYVSGSNVYWIALTSKVRVFLL